MPKWEVCEAWRKSSVQTSMKCACDRRAAPNAKFRLANNCLNGTDVAQRWLPVTVEFAPICSWSRKVTCCNCGSSRHEKDGSPRNSPSSVPLQNECWTMQGVKRGVFPFLAWWGGDLCHLCKDTCHIRRHAAEFILCFGRHCETTSQFSWEIVLPLSPDTP